MMIQPRPRPCATTLRESGDGFRMIYYLENLIPNIKLIKRVRVSDTYHIERLIRVIRYFIEKYTTGLINTFNVKSRFYGSLYLLNLK